MFSLIVALKTNQILILVWQENNIVDNLCYDVVNHFTDFSGHVPKFSMNIFDAFCFIFLFSVFNLNGGCDNKLKHY